MLKNGATPLFIASQNGHEQIVQILLEKGEPNVDLANKVLLSQPDSGSKIFTTSTKLRIISFCTK